MRIQPTVSSRVALFDLVLNHQYRNPLDGSGSVLNYYEKAWEYITNLKREERDYFSYYLNDEIDPDVQVLEVSVMDNNGEIWYYCIPFDKPFKRFKFTLDDDDLNRLIRNV